MNNFLNSADKQKEKKNGKNDLVHLSAFTDMAKAVVSANTIKETIDAVMEQVGEIFDPAYWSLLLRNPKNGELKFSLVIGEGVESLEGMRLAKGKGIAGWVAEHCEPVIVEDVSVDSRFNPEVDEYTQFTTKSIIAVPLISGNKVFGVIELINTLEDRIFSPYEMKLLMTIADFAAIAIEKAYYAKTLRRIAIVDPLTGLYNKRSFSRFLDKQIEISKRKDEEFSILMVDIDRFKEINDNFGHAAGDTILKRVASILRRYVRKSDFPARYGGDEFIVIMPDAKKEDAETIKGRILKAIHKENKKADIPCEVSIGLHESKSEEAAELIEKVDDDMYLEKSKKFDQRFMNIPEYIEDFIKEETEDSDY